MKREMEEGEFERHREYEKEAEYQWKRERERGLTSTYSHLKVLDECKTKMALIYDASVSWRCHLTQNGNSLSVVRAGQWRPFKIDVAN